MEDTNESAWGIAEDIMIGAWWCCIIACPVLGVVALAKYIVWG